MTADLPALESLRNENGAAFNYYGYVTVRSGCGGVG